MKRSALLGSCLMLLPLAACQQETTTSPDVARFTPQYAAITTDGPAVDRLGGVLAGNVSDIRVRNARALNPADYVCPASTPITDFYLNSAFDIIDHEPAVFNTLYSLAADLVPTYEALLFETTATPQYFGYNGQYTKLMTKTERDVKRFWDIDSDPIQVLGMHGTILLDEAKVAATYEAVFGVPHSLAPTYAAIVKNAMQSSTTVHGGNHPFFTFNSVAFSPGGSIPPKIVMGDGILDGYHALGYDDVAPQAIFAHEFAHHIQFQRGYFDDAFATAGSGAEQTQYTEMMADAMSAYFLTHARGLALNKKRVAQFLEVFYEIGDCAFSDSGHHGTPAQRRRAAEFGFNMADQAQKQGHIMSSAAFHDAFVAAYPAMVAPDAH